jgi:hypothetical protein
MFTRKSVPPVEGEEEGKKGSPGGGKLGDAMPSQTSEGDPRSLEEQNEIGWRKLRCDRASRKVSVFFRRFEVFNVSKYLRSSNVYTQVYTREVVIVWSPGTFP